MYSGFNEFLWESGSNAITRVQPFSVELDGTREQAIGAKFPTNINWIYGVSAKVAGAGPNNQTLITLANSYNLFLNLQEGSNFFLKNFPLCDLVFNPVNNGNDMRDQRYLPVKISGRADLDTSTIGNPTPVNSGLVLLYLWYV